MKKILISICIIFSLNSFGQNLDTVTNVTLTLRAQDWAWLVGKHGTGTDSLTRVKIRSIRTQIIAANPATWTTNVQITGLTGGVLVWMYNTYCSAGFQEVFNMGTNNTERTTIWTNIRAINNSAVQYYIGVIDGKFTNEFIQNRSTGKTILLDN